MRAGNAYPIVINLPAHSATCGGDAILYDGAIVNTSLPRAFEGNEIFALLGSKVVFTLPNAEEVILNNYGVIIKNQLAQRL